MLIGTESSGLTYMRMLLEREGYSVCLLREAYRAEETIVAERPSLIIIDDQADKLCAVRLCRQLKLNATIAAIKTVLLLPYDHDALKEATKKACGTDVLTKPVLPHLLLKTVAGLLAGPAMPPVK